MRDLRTRLEQIAGRARVAPDAFEQLERARRRHERDRRITAGTVALLVAVAGSFAAFNAFRTGGGGQTIGAPGGSGFLALWPEQTEAGLAAAQEAVDRGDPGLDWRSDPIEVARRFAVEELLWPSATVELQEGSDVENDDIIFVDLAVPPGTSCDQIVTDAECPTTRTTVTMRRLGRQDGLWSIVETHGEDLALPLVPGDVVSAGTSIRVSTNLPDGERVSMGVALLAACDRRGPDANVEANGGMLEFNVPAVPEGCAGYVYAMRPPTSEGAVAIGSFLLTDAPAIPAIGYLVQEIAAVPVMFAESLEESLSPATTARIVCDGTTVSVDTPLVAAQPDGVHLTFDAASETMFTIIAGASSVDYALGPGGAPVGDVVMPQLAPGRYDLSCRPLPNEGAAPGDTAPLEVIDPKGWYVSTALECEVGERPAQEQSRPVVESGDPVDIARARLTGIQPTDVVERAGYPEATSPEVRIVREGSTVGLVAFGGTPGEWWTALLTSCEGTSFGWSAGDGGPSPTGPTGGSGASTPPSAWDALCASARAGEGNNIHNGRDLHVDGRDLDFDTGCLIAPAGHPLTILFSNLDAGFHMNISIYELTPYLRECLVTGTSPSGKVEHRIFSGKIILGVDEIVYEVGPLEPGAYYFQDDVHPSSNGVLVVEP
jgi:hypothetical protein